jgi:predicted transcriptional regulator
MSIGAICNRQIPITVKTSSVVAAAKLMKVFGARALLVTEEKDGKLFAVGILTDADIVSGIVAKEADPSAVVVGDIMNPDLGTIRESAGVYDTIRLMYKNDLEQVAILDETGVLVGVVTADRLFRNMAEEFIDFSTLVLSKPSAQRMNASH